MRATIQYIEQELKGLYPKTEILAFTRLILEHVCWLNYTEQVLSRDNPLADQFRIKINEMVKRLQFYEPIQYILGETEFLGLKILVSPSVLIPRPETEELVQWVCKTQLPDSPDLLDAGTGSGCIALALKKLIPNAKVKAFDISLQALEVARNNAAINNLEVDFFDADILKWENFSWQKFNIIVSNPPYVRESEKKIMEKNVLKYEPQNALFVADNDPLLFYRRILEFTRRYLSKKGWLFFEINETFGSQLIELIQQYGFSETEIKKDLYGKSRMLRCRKNFS